MLGTGAYGLALASKLAGNGHKVVMWTENKDKEKEFIEDKIITENELMEYKKIYKYCPSFQDVRI